MVRIAAPQEKHRVYDPCSGSGGMLIQARQYVEEHNQDPSKLYLFGQENNGGVWAIAKMNMILHGVLNADLKNGDTIADPQHKEDGSLTRFDRVLSNPPFSQNYSQTDLPFEDRFGYGFCPETGKKADLMFVQHMVSVLRDGGMVATVMPHGVLFRGSAEKDIRKGMIEDDILEAVIGLPSNLFYGTGIPACILVLRKSKPTERQGKVLFINADAEFFSGRAQNYLLPEHIEKIVTTFDEFVDVPNYATVVNNSTLLDEENDCNLNIRRYADNSPPPEPHDVRAHLVGGVPKAEVETHMALFTSHGFDISSVFVERDERYYDFHPDLQSKSSIKSVVEMHECVLAKETEVIKALQDWWSEHQQAIIELPNTQKVMDVRASLLNSFNAAMEPVGLLDRYQIAGIIAGWWNENQIDLRTLAARGFSGLIESWVTTILAALDDEKDKSDPLSHRFVKQLMPEYVDEIHELEQQKAEFDGIIKAAKAAEESEEEDEENEDALSEEELKAKKKELSSIKKRIKTMRENFKKRLNTAKKDLETEDAQELVIALLFKDLQHGTKRYINQHCQKIVSLIDTWWDKYNVTLRMLESKRDSSAETLDFFLKGLGYV
jgi:type I restriction enzyme M protein